MASGSASLVNTALLRSFSKRLKRRALGLESALNPRRATPKPPARGDRLVGMCTWCSGNGTGGKGRKFPVWKVPERAAKSGVSTLTQLSSCLLESSQFEDPSGPRICGRSGGSTMECRLFSPATRAAVSEKRARR